MSPPCRAVMMVAKALDIDLEYEHVEVADMRAPEMLEVIIISGLLFR